MTNQSENLAPVPDMGGGITPESVGTLNLRQEVLDGFLAVRQQHHELQAVLHQVMRRVALPRCRDIGEELLRIKAFYPAGKKGPMGHASRFYSDCKAVTGLSKPSVANYIQIAEGWHRLMDYMADLPEGAVPITSLRGALEALRAMNRPVLPPHDAGALDVEAEQVEGRPTTSRTSYASSTREKALPALDALMAATTISDRHKAQLAKVREALALLLEQIEAEEIAAAEAQAEADVEIPVISAPVELPPPAWAEPDPEPALADAGEDPGKASLPELFPLTAEGMAGFELALAEAGSGAALARRLGCSKQGISFHKNRLRAAVAAA